MNESNLLSDLPLSLPNELIETLAEGHGVRIERIVSIGHASDPDHWYDQDEAEWVMVVKGQAKLQFANQSEFVTLNAGDWINISPHCRHRVASTSQEESTVWLAIFYECD